MSLCLLCSQTLGEAALSTAVGPFVSSGMVACHVCHQGSPVSSCYIHNAYATEIVNVDSRYW